MTYSIASKTTTGSKKEESEPNGDWLRWLDQMTEDDRSVENKRSNDPKYGRYATDHGALVPHTGVSVAIGDCSLEFHTASMVRFAKENELCPGKAEIKEIFEAAVAASGKHPEEAEQYRQICGDLKEMLQYAHRQVSLA